MGKPICSLVCGDCEEIPRQNFLVSSCAVETTEIPEKLETGTENPISETSCYVLFPSSFQYLAAFRYHSNESLAASDSRG